MNQDKIIKGLASILQMPLIKFRTTESGNKEQLYYYPKIEFLDTLASVLTRFPLSKNATHINTLEDIIYYGYIPIEDEVGLILGPISEVPIDNFFAKKILDTLNLPLSRAEKLIGFFESTPRHSLYKFAKIVSYLNNLLGNDELSAKDILPEKFEQNFEETDSSPIITSTNAIEQATKNQDYEVQLYSFVYAGQYGKLKEIVSRTHFEEETGTLSRSALNQNKYLVISSIVLASRAAVSGGLDYNTSMQQADVFFREVDEAKSFGDLFSIHKNMLLTYARLVSSRKLGKPTFSYLNKIQNYIETHIEERITTNDIADALGVSRTYLSSAFKKECNMNLNDYVNRLKIDEAKRLMLTTKIPLITIAHTLGFSSQSLFSSVFKRFENVSPTDFLRDRQKEILPISTET